MGTTHPTLCSPLGGETHHIQEAYIVLEQEKNILNDMVLELTQKLAAQQMENTLLKQENTLLMEQNRQYVQDMAHKDAIIQSLHQETYTTSPHPLRVDTSPSVFTAQINTIQSVRVFTDPPLFYAPNTGVDMIHAQSVPTPGQTSTSPKKVIHAATEIENRMQNTLEKAATVTDVSKFVTAKYNTLEYPLSDDDDGIELDIADDDSSMDSEEQIKINEAKELVEKNKSVDDEMLAVQQEMQAMQRTISDQDIMRGTVIEMKENTYNPSIQVQSDDDVPSSNLFRFESDTNWNPDRLKSHKKDMQAAMAHMVQHHVDVSGTNITE
eukprot:254349_1